MKIESSLRLSDPIDIMINAEAADHISRNVEKNVINKDLNKDTDTIRKVYEVEFPLSKSCRLTFNRFTDGEFHPKCIPDNFSFFQHSDFSVNTWKGSHRKV